MKVDKALMIAGIHLENHRCYHLLAKFLDGLPAKTIISITGNILPAQKITS